MGVIYKIINLVNGKVYIGQTTGELIKRINKHKSAARQYIIWVNDPENVKKRRACTKLYRAMSKHGIDNFIVEILEEMDNDLLDDAEMQYISEFDSIARGYNMKLGGERASHCAETKKVISERTREGISKNIDKFRKHDEVKGLPPHCVFVKIKGSDAVAINKHPNCKWKSFTVRKYGSIENARNELLNYLANL